MTQHDPQTTELALTKEYILGTLEEMIDTVCADGG